MNGATFGLGENNLSFGKIRRCKRNTFNDFKCEKARFELGWTGDYFTVLCTTEEVYTMRIQTRHFQGKCQNVLLQIWPLGLLMYEV